MTYALAIYFLLYDGWHRRQLGDGMTYEECRADLAHLDSQVKTGGLARFDAAGEIRLACETET